MDYFNPATGTYTSLEDMSAPVQDLYGAPSSSSVSNKKKALSVSAAIRLTKQLLQERTFCIEGEVSELNNKPGYKAVYFTIKDEDASLPCLMWKNRFEASGVSLRIGMKVQITGKFTIFAPKGRMNFDVARLVLAGEGDLRARVAALAEKLKREGLMDAASKRAIPAYPSVIGVVTSPRGAAVHDVLRTLRRRYPLARIEFAGVPVEGANAPRDLTAALNRVAASEAEVILLVRGGGSFEDLMPFNDEGLARAIATCPKPVVTGIGHEPDTSIADMVADFRASTPTGAAEAVSPQIDELEELLDSQAQRMQGSLTHRLHRSVVYLDSIASRPLFRDPTTLFAGDLQSMDILQDKLDRIGSDLIAPKAEALRMVSQRLDTALPHRLEGMQAQIDLCSESLKRKGEVLLTKQHHQVELEAEFLVRLGKTMMNPYRAEAALVTSRLNDLSPLHTLERGWSIVTDETGSVVKSVSQVKSGDRVTFQLIDGAVSARVEQEVVSELSELIQMEDTND